MHTLPRSTCAFNGTMVDTTAEDPINCALLCGSNIAMLLLESIQEVMLGNKLNTTRHGNIFLEGLDRNNKQMSSRS